MEKNPLLTMEVVVVLLIANIKALRSTLNEEQRATYDTKISTMKKTIIDTMAITDEKLIQLISKFPD